MKKVNLSIRIICILSVISIVIYFIIKTLLPSLTEPFLPSETVQSIIQTPFNTLSIINIEQHMNLICLITLFPNKIWCDFLNLFSKYKIFIIVDDNTFDLYEFKNNYKNIHFIQIEDIKCDLTGYKDTSYTLNKLISGWDKALYYFGVENNNYNFIWFIEDDVFFYNEDTLLKIDNQYINSDLLSNKLDGINTEGDKNIWIWDKIHIDCLPPWYNAMMCTARMSNRMIKCIHNHAKEKNTLYFLEALLPTIAINNKLKYHFPNEMYNIYYRHTFNEEDINKNNLYHPVKDLNNHINFRKLKEK